MQKGVFKAGAAQVEITPPLGTIMNGEFTARYANRIADPLFAKALVLQDPGKTIVIVLVDICAMRQDFLEQVKTAVFTATGIPQQQQLIAATHTHSGGSVTDLLMGPADEGYRKKLPCLILKAVQQAVARLEPAVTGFGKTVQPQHLLCRRYKMEEGYELLNPVTGGIDSVKTNPFGAEKQIVQPTSTPDPELGFLAVKTVDGKWISILANYCLHYVGDCDRGTISADYFGCFAQALATTLNAPDDFVGIMSNGTSGEVNSWDFMHPGRYPLGNHVKSELIGKDLAVALAGSLETVIWEKDPVLGSQYAELKIRTRKPSETELEKAREQIEQTDYERITFGDPGFFKKVYAREQLLLSEYPDTKAFPVQCFKIGSGIIGALGGEFFSETGKLLKAVLPGQGYFTITMANDYTGYVPPAHELEKGGYECWRCRTSYLNSEAEEQIRRELVTQIKRCRNAHG